MRNLIFWSILVTSFQRTGNYENALDGSETPIVMILKWMKTIIIINGNSSTRNLLQEQMWLGKINNHFTFYLFGQEFFAEGVESYKLSSQKSGIEETFRNQHDLTDQLKIWHDHGTRSGEK